MYILLSIYDISEFSGCRRVKSSYHHTLYYNIMCITFFRTKLDRKRNFCWQIIITWTVKDWKTTYYFEVDFSRNKICFFYLNWSSYTSEKPLQKVNTFKPSHNRPDTYRTALAIVVNDYFIDWVIYKLKFKKKKTLEKWFFFNSIASLYRCEISFEIGRRYANNIYLFGCSVLQI